MVNVQDTDGNTPLHLACMKSLPKYTLSQTVETLLNHGAGVNIPNLAGVTPFHIFITHSSITLISWDFEDRLCSFLQHGADLRLPTRTGETPFQLYLEKTWSTLTWTPFAFFHISHFLRYGADPNTLVKQGEKLLYEVLNIRLYHPCFHYYQVLMTLCKTADLHTPSSNGDLPLHAVIRNCIWDVEHCVELTKALLQRGIDPNQMNGKGETPLAILFDKHYLIENIKMILEPLLRHDLDPMQFLSSSGSLPIYVAHKQWKNDTEVRSLLRVLVDAYVARPESLDQDRSNEQEQNLLWWRRYRRYIQMQMWSDEASNLLESAASTMPASVRDDLPTILLTFAAENILESSKKALLKSKENAGLNSNLVRFRSDQIVLTLRDCRKLGLDISNSWYEFLLELFD